MRILFGFLLLIPVLLLGSCDPLNEIALPPAFAVYRLQNPSLTTAEVWGQPLESLSLAPTPFLTGDDLRSYRWSTHAFAVTARADTELAAICRSHGPTGGVPFIVTVNGERIYLGTFWWGYSSMIPQVPYIDALHDPHTIRRCPSVLVPEDRRMDERVYRALNAQGVLTE